MSLEEKRNMLIRLYSGIKNPPKDIKEDLKNMRKDTLKNEVRATAKLKQCSIEVAEMIYEKALETAIGECVYLTSN